MQKVLSILKSAGLMVLLPVSLVPCSFCRRKTDNDLESHISSCHLLLIVPSLYSLIQHFFPWAEGSKGAVSVNTEPHLLRYIWKTNEQTEKPKKAIFSLSLPFALKKTNNKTESKLAIWFGRSYYQYCTDMSALYLLYRKLSNQGRLV